MNDLGFYFSFGWDHIISRNALDHQLFILALTVLYTVSEWKRVLILVTAFTIGHSITLALSTLNILTVPTRLVEFLIPCTIITTAASNIIKPAATKKPVQLNYFIALFFGLIHGLGFANALKFMLVENQSLGWSLFAFNLGLEAGQIVIVIFILLLSLLILDVLKAKPRYWILSVSVLVLMMSVKMAFDRFPT